MLLHGLTVFLILLVLVLLLVACVITLWQNRRNVPPGLAAATGILALLLIGLFLMGFVVLRA